MTELQATLLSALRQRGGRATLGDLMAATTLSADTVRQNILPALSRAQGHVAVDEKGTLVYLLTHARRPREHTSLRALGWALYRGLQVLYFAGLCAVLLGYFAFYVLVLVALAIAAVAAMFAGGDGCDCDCGGCNAEGCDCGGCDCCDCSCPDFACFGHSPAAVHDPDLRAQHRRHHDERHTRWLARRSRQRGRRAQRLAAVRGMFGLPSEPAVLGLALEREQVHRAPSRLRSVHAFIFGPPRPALDARARERNVVAYLREHSGRITAADTASLTGLPLEQADAFTLDLAARYEGDIEVTEQGAILYTFDGLATTAGQSTALRDWLRDAGAVRVSETARHLGVSAAEARHLLDNLERRGAGHFEHGAESIFVVDVARLDAGMPATSDVHDYTYVWDRLDTSPAVIGLPPGKSSWIVGLNVFNLVLSLVAMWVLRDGPLAAFDMQLGPLFDQQVDLVVFGVLPFAFSVSLFGIPLVRALVRVLGDRVRLRRNAWRVFLLALFHRLEDSERVTAPEILGELGLPSDEPRLLATATRLLERATRRYDGSVDPEGYSEQHGHTYVFERLHLELASAAHARLNVDVRALQVHKIAYSSAE
jgi:hypothetical protein